MTVFEGAVLREALVERVADGLAPVEGDPVVRFAVFGGVRCGVLAAADEIARVYPQLSERIYIRFGMSGWGR